MLIENLKKTPRERIENLMAMQRFAEHVAIAGRNARKNMAERGPGYRAN
jgi:hypothetical protein